MLVRLALAAALLAVQPAPAPQTAPSTARSRRASSVTTPAVAPHEDFVRVALDTEQGRIVLALDRGRAPVTTANFLRYVDAKRLDGITFYRALNLWPGAGLIQGGVRDGSKVYPPIAHEPTSVTGLHHDDGTISMARAAPGSAQADFFITIGKIEAFDAGGSKDGDMLGYAAFGRVVEGMDVVKALLAGAISPTAGVKEGMQGQMLATPVKIVRARREQAP